MNNNILSGKFKFIFISSLLIVLFLKEISCHKTSDEVERDRCKSIGLSKSRGYQVEVHTVETKGKYLLTLHRLVNKKVPPNHLRRPYVLFHGILGSSGGFVTNIKKVTEAGYANPDEDIQHYGQHNKNIYHNLSNEEEQFLRELENVQVGGLAQSLLTSGSLAFTLSNFGYDIWLVNLRGNHYSNKQSRGVRPDASLFYWNFNLDTVAEDDIKPIFDYVRWITQSQQVGVVSYSFSSALIMRFLNQNYEQYGIIRPIIMMAPTLFTGSTMDTKNKLLFRGLSKMLSKNGPYPGDKKNLLGPLCKLKAASRLCFFLGRMMNGHSDNSDSKRLLTLDSSCGRTSVGMLKSIADNMAQSNILSKFYVAHSTQWKNNNPDEIAPDKSIILVHSEKDNISNPSEVKRIKELVFKDMVLYDYQIEKKFGHHDFLFSTENDKLVNIPILRMAIAYDRMSRR